MHPPIYACPRCRTQHDFGAQFCAACGAPLAARTYASPKGSSGMKVFFIVFGVILGVFTLASVIALMFPIKAPTNTPAAPLVSTTTPEPAPRAALSPTPVVNSAPPSPWSYNSDLDDMSGKPYKTATVKSSNTVSFDPTYEGAQHGSLTLRKHRAGGMMSCSRSSAASSWPA
jgi:hypothetical protein